jgi:hypothetical protein
VQSTKGFASNSPAQRRYVSAKGGRAKVKKGLALLPVEKAREIQRRGGLKRQDILRKEKEQNEQNSISSGNTSSS